MEIQIIKFFYTIIPILIIQRGPHEYSLVQGPRSKVEHTCSKVLFFVENLELSRVRARRFGEMLDEFAKRGINHHHLRFLGMRSTLGSRSARDPLPEHVNFIFHFRLFRYTYVHDSIAKVRLSAKEWQ